MMREKNNILNICEYLILWILFMYPLFSGQLNRTSGLYDLDSDGRKEVLIISSSERSAYLVEFSGETISDTLWSYTLPRDNYFTDVSVLDLDRNGQPDLVATSKISISSKSSGWLYIFQGNTKGFSDEPLVAGKSGLELDNIRPMNLSKVSGMPGHILVSFGTPVRKTLVCQPIINDGILSIENAKILSSSLIQNGFGHMYSGSFSSGGKDFIAQFSAEINTLKIVVYDVKNNLKPITSDVLGLGVARSIIGPEVQPFNNLKSNEEGLLIPFRTGEVKILNIKNNKLVLDNSDFSHEDLFLDMQDPNKNDIANLVNTRIESGLYNMVKTKQDYINDETSSSFNPNSIDGPTLVDYLNEAGIVKKPSLNLKNEVPNETSDMNSSIWAAKASIKIEEVDSTILLTKDTLSFDPIPDEDKEVAFHKTVFGPSDSVNTTWEDTVKNALVPESLNDLRLEDNNEKAIDLYYVMVMTPSKGQKDRYVFDGEAPFGVNVSQVPPMGEATHFNHSVSANLKYLRRGNDYDFAYTLKEQITDSITTLTMVHDMQTNIIFMSISPEADSISQSYQPESFDPKLFEFPDYFFEGFPTSLGMDFKNKLIKFSFDDTGDTVNYQGLYFSATTPSNPSQSLAVFLNEGTLQAIRGEVKVRENGSKKITTEFDIVGYIKPSAMFSRLIQEEFSDSLKTNLLQGTYLEEPLFGPDGSLPKVLHERRLPAEQFDQKNPNIPVDPLKGIYPEGRDGIDSTKSNIEKINPDPQGSLDKSNEIENETINITDTLKLETIKSIPDSTSVTIDGMDSLNNLPESIETQKDSINQQ